MSFKPIYNNKKPKISNYVLLYGVFLKGIRGFFGKDEGKINYKMKIKNEQEFKVFIQNLDKNISEECLNILKSDNIKQNNTSGIEITNTIIEGNVNFDTELNQSSQVVDISKFDSKVMKSLVDKAVKNITNAMSTVMANELTNNFDQNMDHYEKNSLIATLAESIFGNSGTKVNSKINSDKTLNTKVTKHFDEINKKVVESFVTTNYVDTFKSNFKNISNIKLDGLKVGKDLDIKIRNNQTIEQIRETLLSLNFIENIFQEINKTSDIKFDSEVLSKVKETMKNTLTVKKEEELLSEFLLPLVCGAAIIGIGLYSSKNNSFSKAKGLIKNEKKVKINPVDEVMTLDEIDSKIKINCQPCKSIATAKGNFEENIEIEDTLFV